MIKNTLIVLSLIIGLPALLMGCQTAMGDGETQGAGDPAVELTDTTPRYWNYLRMRESESIDVAMFNFGHALKAQGGNELLGFEVAGEDRRFYPAQAEIGSHIIEGDLKVTWISLNSAHVKEPYFIRYAIDSGRAQANLVNGNGEQAIPFTTLTADRLD